MMDKFISGDLTSEQATTAYDNLIIVRKSKRSLASKTITKVTGTALNSSEIQLYIGKLETLSSELKNLHTDLGSLCLTYKIWSKEEYLTQSDQFDDYEDRMQIALITLKVCMTSLEPKIQSSSERGAEPKFLLPKIELPTFSGRPEEYHKFITTFNGMIEKYNLDDYEKFLYLQKQLTGHAKTLLSTIKVTDMTFTKAKDLLNEAYCDKLEQQFAIIRKMSKLQMTVYDDPYNWICQSRVLKDQIESLNITTDLILQYFLWEGLNDNFKSQYVNITNVSKPSLTQLLDNAFEANRRYAAFGNKGIHDTKLNAAKTTGQIVSLATKVNKPLFQSKPFIPYFNRCSLCKYDGLRDSVDHKLNKCTIYPDPKDKIEKLKTIDGCTKCGYGNHIAVDCRYKFKNTCIICHQSHYSFLCTNKSSGDQTPKTELNKNLNFKKENKNKKFRNTTNQLIQLAVQNTAFEKVILPTFSVNIRGEKKSVPIRGLFDTASQSSFVTQDIADKLNLKVIERNICVTIYGFNEKKSYNANLVELELMIENEPRIIRAMTIPRIRTDIYISEVKNVAAEFERKSYTLADSNLKNEHCKNVQILLGMDNSSILWYKSVEYGIDQNKSTYLDTSLGIMLMGNVIKMINNIRYLPLHETEEQNNN